MILVFGSINLDLIFPVPALPAPGQTILGAAARIEPGGKGANQAVAAARDGANVAFAGAVGGDPLAGAALAGLAAAGIDVSRVARDAATTGLAAIMVDPAGGNQIAVAAGANLAARAAQVEDALLGPETTLLLQMEVAADETAALIRRARAAGSRILLNLAPAAALPRDALAAVDFLLVNEAEAAWLAGRQGSGADAAALHAALGIGVIRSLGAAGVETASHATSFHLPGFQIAAVDTTAAGDCLAGVLAAGLDRELALATALLRANAAAALCCTRKGSQGSLPAAAEIDAFLRREGAMIG